MQAAEKHGTSLSALDKVLLFWLWISLCSTLWSFWISSHWKLVGADRVGIPGGHTRWMGTMDFSTFCDIWITAEWGCLLFCSLCILHMRPHTWKGKGLSATASEQGRRKQVYVQHHYTAYCHYTVALTLRDDTRTFKGSPIPQKALPALSLAMVRTDMSITENLTVVQVQSYLLFVPRHHPFSFHNICN